MNESNKAKSTALLIHPQRIKGAWTDGFALDRHTESSEFLGYDSGGRAQYDTRRTPIGEAVYQLKYGSRDAREARTIARTALAFIAGWKITVDVVVPAPASRQRAQQPVHVIAQLLAKGLRVPFEASALSRARTATAVKDLPVDERQAALAGALRVDRKRTEGLRILLVDDLYQSGATLNAVAGILLSAGAARAVYALAMTRTKR